MDHTVPSLSRRRLLVAIAPLLAGLGATRAGADERVRNETLARRLADYVCSVRFHDLDPAVVVRAKEELLYHAGLAFSGARTAAGREALDVARSLCADCGGACTVIGAPGQFRTLEAAFANASRMRALGLDDVLFPSATHAGLLTYPVALAIAEQERCTGQELLTAVVLGYELLGKLVVDEDGSRAPRRPSMPFGAFAGVAAASRLLKLTAAQTAHAIGYAADAAMGLKEGNEQQPTHIYGLIARNAITAALVARAGGETAPTVLEGKYGFYATLVGRIPDSDALVGRLGHEPEILRATQKRFPGTAMNIVPVQLVLELVNSHGLSAANVEHVDIELPEDRRTFEDSTATGPYPTRTQAESSVPFQTAIILLDGHIDFARYEHPNAPEILAVTKRVRISLATHANIRYARVAMTTRDGQRYEREGDHYEFPPLDALAWLARDGEGFVPRAQLEAFAAGVRTLETMSDVGPLMALLRATQPETRQLS
jgi:2-methylcitrate dehydratase PrpD